jgi:signal transduction histidine kinase
VTRPTEWLSKWIPILTACLYFAAVALRTWLYFREGPALGRALGLLLLWLLLIASEPRLSRRWPAYFPLYILLQTGLVFVMMALPGTPDFMGALLGVLSMQVLLRLPTRVGVAWIGLCALGLWLLLSRTYQYQAIALALVYTAGNVFLGSFTRTIRKTQAVRQYNQTLAGELELANRRLQDTSAQLEQLAAARERDRLARELHDSVTQTVFSMNLTSQSAALLLARDQAQVGAQLERLYTLSRSALSEMQLLIDELKPGPGECQDLPASLHQLLADSRFHDNLTVSIEARGEQKLTPAEEQALLRIVQEALINVLKHAGTSQAKVRLHLEPLACVEIEDHGQGFDLQQVQHSGHMGLNSMRERAAEIGWALQIETSPGAGTCIRVEQPGSQEVKDGTSRF